MRTYSTRHYFAQCRSLIRRLVVGQVRALANEFGRPGIEGKRGKTNHQVLSRGYLRIDWGQNRRLARKFQAKVNQLWGSAGVYTRRYRKG